MRSIGARLTLYYVGAATLSTAILFAVGGVLLETRLITGLDALNAAEFRQLKARLGNDYASLNPKVINQRIRETADAASALFFINVDEPKTGMIFYSRNLDQRSIPDVKGSHNYNVTMPRLGELRVGEYLMPPFDVSIATPMTQVREGMQNYFDVSLGLLLSMLIVSIAIGLALSRLILAPLIFISETARRIGSDNLSERIPDPEHNDEFAALTQLLNKMFDRLETSFNQIKRFAADASHELKTPLSLIRLHSEKLLEDGALHPAGIDAVLVQLEEVARLNQIIEEMLFLSRAEAHAIKLKLEVADPRELIDSFAQDATVLAEHHGCRFQLINQGVGCVAFEARWLRQVWLNLLTNALNVSSSGATIFMRSELGNNAWQVSFEDEGHGLAPDQLARIFDRFTQFGSAQHKAGGSGLGLAICKSIVTLHAGTITASNRVGRSGLRVVITLPLAPS